jgi:ketosteroid isomerase-like protein
MKTRRGTDGLLVLALLWAACGPAEDTEPAAEEAMETAEAMDPAAAQQQILDLSDEWIAQMRASSVEGMVEFYASGGVAMPPYQQAVAGQESLTAYFQSFFGQGIDQFQMNTDEVNVAGDWAFARGTYSLMAPLEEGGEPVMQTGKWGSIDERQADGSWKIVGNLWNTDAPPPGVSAMQIPRYGATPTGADPLCVESMAGLDAAFDETFTEGDLANLLAIHADDAIRMPPEMGPIAGKNELSGFLGFFLTSFPTRDLTLTQVGRVVSGDVGSTWGAYQFTYTPPRGEVVSGRGKYLGVGHRNENGCWVFNWVIWNSDSPPTVATGA